LWNSVFDINIKLLNCILFHNFCIIESSSFQVGFILTNKKKSCTVQGQAIIEVVALLGICVWLRNVAQPATTVLVNCHGGCAISLMTTLLVTHGALHCGDTAGLINNIPYLLFYPLE